MSTAQSHSRDGSELTAPDAQNVGDSLSHTSTAGSLDEQHFGDAVTPGYQSSAPTSPSLLSRNSSFIGRYDLDGDYDGPPLDKLTVLDLFDHLALPSRLEKLQATLQAQKEKVLKQRNNAKTKAVAEWRKRVPTAEEQLVKYRRRMKRSVDDINKRWNETVTINAREKISFISAVLNIFISGYLIGALPEYFYFWFTAQILYFMPIRYITYHRRGYHYFLADLCYFVNFLCLLSIWVFPKSKRLFISTYCLAYGNNAVAIVMWRNSLVFHSLDKVTSLFIHIMPPAMLHCLVHLTPSHVQAERFPAIYNIKYSAPGSPQHYSLTAMLAWATLPYAVWQLSYHFFITVRRREQIAAGRPTSFTWLRKSYANTWLGKFVLWLPNALQEPAFMLIQYSYALLTIIPCPLWFWYRWASATFLMIVFTWSIWNGANYYMDIFGKKFQKELEQMKRDMSRLQNSPGTMTPAADPERAGFDFNQTPDTMKAQAAEDGKLDGIDNIPLLDADLQTRGSGENAGDVASTASTTGADSGIEITNRGLKERQTNPDNALPSDR